MENSRDVDGDGDGRDNLCSTSSTSTSLTYRLFGRQCTVHQIMGGGRAADVLLWKQRQVSCGIIAIATVAWLLFERSGLTFLSICADILLILTVLLFLRANYAAFRNKQLEAVPELVLSEEMVNNAAAAFRVKINDMLLMAHDITLGKDLKLFCKVMLAVFALWLLSVIGGLVSFITFAYIGTMISITIPALYNRYEDRVDSFAGLIHQKFLNFYKIVDESVRRRISQRTTRDKEL